MFTTEWVRSLRVRMIDFLNQQLRSLEVPLIYRMWEAYQRHKKNVSANLRAGAPRQPSPAEIASELQADHAALQQDYKQLVQEKEAIRAQLLESQSTWTSFAKDILAISQKLYRAIQTLPTRDAIPRELLAASQEQIVKYEAFLNRNQTLFNRGLSNPGLLSSREAVPQTVRSSTDSVPSAVPTEGKQTDLRGESEPMPQLDVSVLDYAKITSFLATSSDDLRVCALLQALRWRVIRNNHRATRQHIIQDYIQGDLLGHSCNGEAIARLLKHPNKKYLLSISFLGWSNTR